MIPWLRPDDPPERFPPVASALSDPDGLLCAGGDLSAPRLIEAYRRGIFPWYAEGQPILWWSPDPRTVLIPDEFHASRSLRRTLRNAGYRSTLDRAFDEVVRSCGDPAVRPEGTWITRAMRTAYERLHRLGYAHSVETWLGERLVGGLYGVVLGRVFFGESMFTRERDASKVALAHLVEQLRRRGGELIDCQVASAHLASLGARTIPREAFVARLQQAIPAATADRDWALR
jgi:leucyl/phenylalanyl-tRNA--protein transferase